LFLAHIKIGGVLPFSSFVEMAAVMVSSLLFEKNLQQPPDLPVDIGT